MFKLVKPPTLKVLSPIGTLLYSLLYVTLNEKCMAKKKTILHFANIGQIQEAAMHLRYK